MTMNTTTKSLPTGSEAPKPAIPTAVYIAPVIEPQPDNPFTRDELRRIWELYDLFPHHLPLNLPRVFKRRVMEYLKSYFEDERRLTRQQKNAALLYDKVKATRARKLTALIKAADKAVALVG